jgi:16S rRNA (guanine527-N7)-methyltransferase
VEQFSILRRHEAELGYRLDGEVAERLARYRDALLERNRQFNLTRVTDPAEIETRLFLDSLAILPLLQRFDESSVPAGALRLVDIGAGAGFPGLVLKIARPAIELVLIEATAKKVAFLREAAAALGLDGTIAIHGRAEELAHDARFRAGFDVVTARAVARLPALLEICMPFCRKGGRGIFSKGRDVDQEVRDASDAANVMGCRILGVELPEIVELQGTSFVLVEQVAPSPRGYPRRPGIPAMNPL